jgi:outer membrane protein assembly factor BamA/autotransporter translocation and assembly factor TamB
VRSTRRAAAITGLLVAAALVALALGWFPQALLREPIESRVRRLVGERSRVGAVRIVPGRLSAEVDGLVLDAPAYRLEARRLIARLSPRTLTGGGLVVDRLDLEGAVLVLRAPDPNAPPAAPPRGPLVVREIVAAGATVRYEDPALGGPIVLRGVDLRGGIGEGELRVEATGGAWQRPQAVSLGPLAARLRISPDLDVEIRALEAGLERTRLRMSGTLGRLGALRPDLGFELAADLAELQAFFPIAPASGVLEAKGRASGPVDALHLAATLSGQTVQVSGWPVERIAGDLAYTAGRPRTASAAAELALLGGTGRAEARLDGSEARGRIELRGVDVQRVRRQLGAAADVSGRGSAVVRFEGDVDRPLRIEAETSVEGRAGRVPRIRAEGRAQGRVALSEPELDLAWSVAVDADPPPDRPAGAVRLTAEGTARGALPPAVDARFDLRALGGEATGEVSARGRNVRRLAVSGRALDLARLVDGASGQAEIEATASGPIDTLTGTARIAVDALGWRTTALGPLRADVESRKGAATARIELPLLRATAVVHAPGPSRQRPTLTGSVTLAETPLAPFAGLLGPGRPLEGEVSATAEFAVPVSSPRRSTARVLVGGLEARSGRWIARAAAPFALALDASRGTVSGLRLEGEGFTAHIDGSAGLDAEAPLDLHASAEVRLPALAPAGWAVEGEARAEVAVTGTRGVPRVEGSATLQGVSVQGPALPPAKLEDARFAFRGDAIEIEALRAAVAGGSAVVEGRVPLAAAYPKARRDPALPAPHEEAALTASWNGIETGRLLPPSAPGGEPALLATLSGRAELRGGLASVSEPRATLTLPATTGRLGEMQVDLAPAEIRLDEGRLRADALLLRAGEAALEVSGTADLSARTIDAVGRGTLELRALSAVLEDAALTGTSELDLRVRGPFDAPRPNGTIRIRDATLRARALPQAFTGIATDVVLDGDTLTLRNATASLGGGTLTAGGTARISGRGLADSNFTLTGRDLGVRYPEGMRSRLDADLALTGRTGAFRLAGTVRARRGLYQLDTALADALRAPEAEPTVSPLLRSVALDIRVETDNPVLVRSTMVRRLQATGRLTVRGDLETPAPVGTLDVEPGGEVVLQGRQFVIGSGRLAYAGNWDPELSVRAAARIPDMDRQAGTTRGDVDVTVSVEGQLMRPRLSLSSDPPRSQMEIASLITTGDSQNPSARLAVGGPAASLLAGRLSRGLTGLGLGQISIQPELVAKEGTVEPGARFTFGRRLTNRVNFVYSASLQDAENTFVELQGTPGRDVDLSVRRTSEGEFIYGAGQRFRFGGSRTAPARREGRTRVAGVRLEGDSPSEPGDLGAALRTGAGDRRSVWDLQDDAERLRRRLAESGYLEAQVGARFEGDEAVFTVRSGSRYEWTVRGMPAPPGLEDAVRESLFAEEALEHGRALLLQELRERGHLRAVVRAAIEPSDGARVLAFSAEPGPVLAATVAFPGAQALSHSRLLDAAGGAGALITDPAAAVAGIQAAYRAAHFLAARVDPPRTREEGTRVDVTVPVVEGPQARIAAVRFEGATQPEGLLRHVAGLSVGSNYDPEQALAAGDRLRAHYYGLGYPAVRVAARVQPEGTDLGVVFEVAEGDHVTVGRVVLQGLRRAREGLVRRAISLRPGDPLDPRKLAEMERRLMDLGLFARAAATVSDDNPATITVSVDEGDRLRAGYRASYGKDQGTRAELDGELRGLLGAGLRLGARVTAGPDLREVRPYLHLPAFLPTGSLTLSAFRLSEDLPLDPEVEDGETFERVQTGAQLQATRPLRDRWSLVYGYHIKKVTIDSPFLTTSRWVAGLETSVLRDTRDDPTDARRGRFWSASLELAPQALGSDFDFMKGFAQAFFSAPLRERWTWAHGYRVGLAHVFNDEPLVTEEGFEAGGANSIRGFETGSVGPEGYPFGRQATLVINQELRYRHPSGLGGVVFWDLGNTWATASDVSLDLRHALGAGLRWSSPFGLLRLDLGVPLARREGEDSYQLFFSFGQAF